MEAGTGTGTIPTPPAGEGSLDTSTTPSQAAPPGAVGGSGLGSPLSRAPFREESHAATRGGTAASGADRFFLFFLALLTDKYSQLNS